jgi:hypothetical protein
MKQATLVAVVWLAATFVSAQTTVLDGPAAAQWYNRAHEIQLSKHITEDFVLHPPPCEIPPNMMDTLKKYDWLNIGDYHYSEGTFSAFFNEIDYQENIETFDADGVWTSYSAYGISYWEKEHIVTPSYNPPFRMSVKQKYGRTFLSFDDDHEEDKGAPVIYYKNGVLLVDVDDGGAKITDRNYLRRFRYVWIAVPRVR